jgi:hypothetical protein
VGRDRTQEAILRAEFFWYGATLGPPKTYDAGTSYSTPPSLRSSEDRAEQALASEREVGTATESPDPVRRFSIEVSEAGWEITFDGAE